jgi:hypothetical protein
MSNSAGLVRMGRLHALSRFRRLLGFRGNVKRFTSGPAQAMHDGYLVRSRSQARLSEYQRRGSVKAPLGI